jgi:hypothetical protein
MDKRLGFVPVEKRPENYSDLLGFPPQRVNPIRSTICAAASMDVMKKNQRWLQGYHVAHPVATRLAGCNATSEDCVTL